VIGTGYIVLGQMVTSWQVVGIAIVVAALVYASHPERRRSVRAQSGGIV